MDNTLRIAVVGILLVSGLFGRATSTFAQTFPAVGVGLTWGFSADRLPDVPVLVENVPASLRQVPSHPGDTWIYGSQTVLRTIPFDSIEPNPLPSSAALYVAAEITVRRLRMRSGPVFTFYSEAEQGLVPANTGATRLANQRNLPDRGIGQSLVYYNMYVQTSRVPGWLNEASLNVSRHVSLIGGYSFTTFALVVETGYDRFNRLETYDTVDGGRVTLWRAYGGVEAAFPFAQGHSGGFHVLVGTLRDPIAANGMTVHADGRWFVTAGVSLHHVLAARW